MANIEKKMDEAKALKAENARLRKEAKDVKDLLVRSHEVVERAQDFEVLERENADLRAELNNLKQAHEASIASFMESSSHENERLGKELALKDQEIEHFQDEVEKQSTAISEIQGKLESRIRSKTPLTVTFLLPLSSEMIPAPILVRLGSS